LAKSLIISFQYNIQSVYFFYSNPVYFFSTGVRLHATVNTVRLFSFAMESQQWDPFAL